MHIKAKNKDSGSGSGGPMSTFWGQSSVSVSDAIQQAVASAKLNLVPANTLEWLELFETRGGFDENGNLQFQVAVRIGYQYNGMPA